MPCVSLSPLARLKNGCNNATRKFLIPSQTECRCNNAMCKPLVYRTDLECKASAPSPFQASTYWCEFESHYVTSTATMHAFILWAMIRTSVFLVADLIPINPSCIWMPHGDKTRLNPMH